MLTEDTVKYLHRHILREVGLPMLNKMFAGFEDVLGGADSKQEHLSPCTLNILDLLFLRAPYTVLSHRI